MKTLKILNRLMFMLAMLDLILTGQSMAQTFTTLYSFAPISANSHSPSYYTNSDGANPQSALVLSGSTLYGTAYRGGTNGSGTIFAINTDGTDFTNLYNFTSLPSTLFSTSNSDGAQPAAGIVLLANTLYGTASSGGTNGNGTVFAIKADGTGFTNLHNFSASPFAPHSAITNSDGASPNGLLLSGYTLYGTAAVGGSNGSGTVFAINTDGTGFTNLHIFSGFFITNGDGATPVSILVLSGNTLYGTAYSGGLNGAGTIFAVNTDGSGFTNLHSFNNGVVGGANPSAGLILSGNTLYGTTSSGGGGSGGVIFSINTDGSAFTNMSNIGAQSHSGLILSGNTLYGTAGSLGGGSLGVIFAINTNGTGFTNLFSFPAPYGTNSDGFIPAAGLILSSNTLYGTASEGGTSDQGTVFSLSFQPQLTITPSGTNVILTWPTNVTGFSLESTTNLISPVIWNVVSVTNGQNVMTNPISGTQMFYRLSQ